MPDKTVAVIMILGLAHHYFFYALLLQYNIIVMNESAITQSVITEYSFCIYGSNTAQYR